MEDRPPKEAELVRRAKRGELDAYEEIVRMHGAVAFRTAWLITGSAADAEEAAQDAFVKAQKALNRFREGAPFRPWLLAIVANEARNRMRSAGRRATLAVRVAEERRPGDAVPSPEAALLARSSGCVASLGRRWRDRARAGTHAPRPRPRLPADAGARPARPRAARAAGAAQAPRPPARRRLPARSHLR